MSSTEGERRLVAFSRELRHEGVSVGTGRIGDFCRAAALLPPEDLYWAGRGTLVGRREDIPTYDLVFERFFGRPPELERDLEESQTKTPQAGDAESMDEPGEGEEDEEPELLLASAIEILKEKSFARCTDEELAALAQLMTRIRLAVPMRRTRRYQRSRGGSPDLRRTIRRSFRTGGEPVERVFRERRKRRRRLVLFLDVSGSMASYSRALLVFAYAVLHTDARWEAYAFGTRLTRLTRVLDPRDPNAALERAAAEVFDWDGGTRIGESLRDFLRTQSSTARGSIVIICSDGLEVGDPSLLAGQMERLSQLAYRVVWLNPLKEDPAYEPLARGMSACLPHIDLFVSGHNLASLEELGRDIARL
jgi:uncharacterized protein with von Willebrand factor type A (vWA) domain